MNAGRVGVGCRQWWTVLLVAATLVSCAAHPLPVPADPPPEPSMDAFFEPAEKEAALLRHGIRLYENGIRHSRYQDLSRSCAVFSFLKERYRNPQAADYFDRAAKDRQATLESLTGRAESALAEGDVYSAALNYRGVLALNPEDADARSFFHAHRQKVEQILQESLAGGDGHFAREELDKAEKSYRRALALKPDDPPILEKIARVELKKRQTAGHVFGKGVYAFEREDYQTAREAFQSAIEKEYRPEDAAAYLRKIEMVELYGRLEDDYKKGDLVPARKTARAILATYGDYQSTRKYLHLIDQKLSQQLHDWYQEAVNLYNGKEYAKAKKLFDSIRRIDPDYENVREYSTRCQAVMETLGES